ncbi:MAG: hypothetical protein OXQ29_03505 [Rhodospirillaceae bacterium]|nr:hypothetical protein [Rhodospirillaceae bacterium]
MPKPLDRIVTLFLDDPVPFPLTSSETDLSLSATARTLLRDEDGAAIGSEIVLGVQSENGPVSDASGTIRAGTQMLIGGQRVIVDADVVLTSDRVNVVPYAVNLRDVAIFTGSGVGFSIEGSVLALHTGQYSRFNSLFNAIHANIIAAVPRNAQGQHVVQNGTSVNLAIEWTGHDGTLAPKWLFPVWNFASAAGQPLSPDRYFSDQSGRMPWWFFRAVSAVGPPVGMSFSAPGINPRNFYEDRIGYIPQSQSVLRVTTATLLPPITKSVEARIVSGGSSRPAWMRLVDHSIVDGADLKKTGTVDALEVGLDYGLYRAVFEADDLGVDISGAIQTADGAIWNINGVTRQAGSRRVEIHVSRIRFNFTED